MNLGSKKKQLQEWIEKSNKIVIITGKEIEHYSSSLNFRSSNGYYKKGKFIFPKEILSHHYFLAHPESFYHFLKSELFYGNGKPNKVHMWIKNLEENHDITVIAQNVLSMHQKAGSKNVLELYGNINDYICMKCGKTYGKEILKKELPICICKGLIRPNIILYEEPLDEETLSESIFAILRADMMIVIGSLVGNAASLLTYYQGNHFVMINKEETPYDKLANLVIHEDIMKVVKLMR